MSDRRFSEAAAGLPDSVTHGTMAKIAEINRDLPADAQVIDLSIGTLDLPADPRIDQGVCEFIQRDPKSVHAFAPVKGFPFVRAAIAAKLRRMHGADINPEAELIITPGGIKGALTVLFHTFLNPQDEVVIPVPNWPHYADMLRLHQAVPRFVSGPRPETGLTPHELRTNITDKTRLVILGDCINPTGKVYSSDELRSLAEVIATHNLRREQEKKSPIQVLFDCPYEAHIPDQRAVTFALIEVDIPGYGQYSMRQCTSTLSGPGKTYGMHGDRIGYIWAAPDTIEMAARVQVNTNSFACTYGQIATHLAVQEAMDDVLRTRACHAWTNLHVVLDRLTRVGRLKIVPPKGGYFLFVDFSEYASGYRRLGHGQADQFLLRQARVAAISGQYFGQDGNDLTHFVRLNCGRSLDLLNEACTRIGDAVSRLGTA